MTSRSFFMRINLEGKNIIPSQSLSKTNYSSKFFRLKMRIGEYIFII